MPELIRLAFCYLKSFFLALLGAGRSPLAPQGQCSSWPMAVSEIEINQWTAALVTLLYRVITTNLSKSTERVERESFWKQIWKKITYIHLALVEFFFSLTKSGEKCSFIRFVSRSRQFIMLVYTFSGKNVVMNYMRKFA